MVALWCSVWSRWRETEAPLYDLPRCLSSYVLVTSYPSLSTRPYPIFFLPCDGPSSYQKTFFKLCFPSLSSFGLRLSTAAKSSSNAS